MFCGRLARFSFSFSFDLSAPFVTEQTLRISRSFSIATKTFCFHVLTKTVMNWTPPPPPPHPPPSIHAARTEAHLADVSRLHTGPIMVPRRTPNTAPSQHSRCGRLAARRMRSSFTPYRRFTSSFLNGPEHIQNRLLLEGVSFIINPKTREGMFNYRVSDQKPSCVCVCVCVCSSELKGQRS